MSEEEVVLNAENFRNFIPADIAGEAHFKDAQDLGSIFTDYHAMKKTGAFDPAKFRDYIPDEFKDDPTLAQVKDLPGLFKMFVNSQKMLGGEKIVIPTGKLDTPDMWEKVFKALGRPDKPEDYNWKVDEGLPEGLKPDPEFDKMARGLFHKLGLNQKQAAEARAWWNNYQKQILLNQVDAFNKMADATEAQLRNEFGENYDRYTGIANRVLNTYGGTPEEIKEFTDRYGNDPILIRTLAKLGKQLSEDALATGGEAEFMLSAEAARAKAADIATNKSNPLNEAYFNRNHPRHAEAMETYMRLHKIATGEIKP